MALGHYRHVGILSKKYLLLTYMFFHVGQQLALDVLYTRGSETYSDLNFSLCAVTHEPKKYLLCTQKALRVCPPAGLVSVARIFVSDLGEYKLQVLLRTIEKGRISSVEAFIPLYSKISQSGGYKFCPGVKFGLYNEKYASVLYDESKCQDLVRAN